ncbi:hypothetical protein C7123_05620 [Tannerella serpentiformis]|uniref:BACON domain-containing protein n=1 Tax=Tannerella serpentiformis TaxID=712710 RepID=UPI0009F1EB61|nr:BACON domain-containing carbohydrate-binding protein [Tannerella serpentiformis]AOH41527.2 hypothetical protein BCB71_10615 [Tannerella serpentiformis]AVV53244.1 hypothetical protein C7123_05620 [Tannerella serpentiformis]
MDSRTNYKNMLLALLLILAGLAGAIAPQTAVAEDYGIHIGGKMITSGNYTNISASGGFKAVQSGTVTYDPASFTLTLNNATIEANDLGIYNKSKSYRDLHIVLVGNNTIISRRHSIETSETAGELFISGSGTLTLMSKTSANAIFLNSRGSLYIEGCTIIANGPICVKNSIWIKEATVKVDLSYDHSAFIAPVHMVVFGSIIKEPSGAVIESFKNDKGESYETVMLNGRPCKQVTITPGSKPTARFTFIPEELIKNRELKVDELPNVVSFSLACTDPYKITGIVKPDWLSVSGNSSDYEGLHELTIHVQANSGPEREGVITFKTNAGDVNLKVTQEAAGTIKFTREPKELNVDANRNDVSFTLSCTQPYRISEIIQPHWLSLTGQKLTEEAVQELTILVQANLGPEREDAIILKTTKGNVTLKVTQAAGSTKPEKAGFTLEPKELKTSADGGEREVTLRCNKAFSVDQVDLPDWISILGLWISEDHKSRKYSLEFQPNTGAERKADVVFKTSAGDVKLKVTQAAAGTKPEARFTLEPKELKVETDGGKKEVKLSCNQAFELNKVTVPSWMERVPSSATSDEKSRVCAFNIKPNTGAERKGEIIFHTDKGDVTLKVTQAAGAKPEPTLTLSPDMLTFPTGGGKQTVNVKSDYGWDTKASAASASWMKLTTDVKTGKIVVEVTPNTSTKKRGATIAVISSRRRIGHRTPITRHILVTQEAAKAVEPPVAATGISLNPAAMTMGSGGGTVGFNVYAGKGWTISGSPDWMHPDATRGSGTRLVIVRFDRNESGAERTGKLTVKSDDGKAERTFTLTQRAGQRKPTPSPGSTPSEEYDYDLALNPEEITVGPSDGAGSSISVATSRLWAGSTTEDWIRLESAVGRGNGSFTFTVAPNPSKEMRHGTITVRTQQGMDELKVAIHQQGNDGSVVPPAEVKVSNVTLDPATLTVNGDLSTALISAIVSPDNARNKGLLWMSSNASVATVQVFTPKQSAALPQLRFAPDADDYALVTIVGKGKAVITAAASDGSGIVARCEVNVLSTVANTVPYAPQAKVYTVGPTLYLSLPTPETVQVYTLAGTLYRTWQAPAGDTSVTLPAGTYIIKVGPLTEKVVVR